MTQQETSVIVQPGVVRRGSAVEIAVTLDAQAARRETYVGVLCREWFKSVDDRDNEVWTNTTVHEQRAKAESIPGEQGFGFELPVDAPFSYQGESVRYRWEAFAVQPVRLRPDRRETVLFEVLP